MNPVFEAFELAAQYRQLAELLAERHGDNEESRQVIADTLDGMSEPLDERLENLAKMVRNIESAKHGVEQTMAHLQARHYSLDGAARRARKLILDLMQVAGRERVNTALFSMAVKKNPLAVVVDDEAALPEAFLVRHAPPPPTPDRRAIAAAIKAGQTVPGAHGEHGSRLEIQ
ncbi:siphovirus Gp157 family protein [Noviherbaspirillum galbum]|uniref:Siphovirus Gp157 family protein n=1 Tax=Noviherbaspirillum galbum TaxID=2709383 RepID=A0A6B3SJ87_9BURK|nr:siphovirus Gp157 family protein [Noviherbaspirillum galbum]NEX60638.1 siphovirus Gp157 family protein [Noviherbaspirillum galbum]